ncbi:MAG TPA: site-2 protease family protein [Bacteriovoracaceae bacterium]|nr:site-2 protease family protein [Bacteriovoracaceae bacterium]
MSSILFNIAQSMPGFLLAIVVHEAAHAWVANKFGDATAKNEGRMTLNPAAHYDPWGTIFLPLLGAITGGFIIGYARPVPVEARNFKNWRQGLFWVSFAGPLSNILLGCFLAIIAALIITQVSPEWEFYEISIKMLSYAVGFNFILVFFNLIPLPPLDGSKMVSSFLKGEALRKYDDLARYTPIILIVVLALSWLNIFHILGYIFMPANWVANFLMFSFIDIFGGIG